MVKARWLFVFAALAGCARTVESAGTHYEEELFYPPTTQGGYPRESHFVSDEEGAALAATFDWRETDALPEFEPDGSPAVFYAVVQVTSMDESNLLHEANIPTSIEPFFQSERRALPDSAISLTAGNTHQGFLFSMMPASAYNIARRSALEGQPLFHLIALRTPPSDAPVNVDGSINMQVFMEQGFTWPTRLENPFAQGAADIAPSGDLGVAHEALLSTILTDLGRLFAETGTAVERFFSDLLGDIDRLFAPSTADVTFELVISSPDADWEAGAPLRRTWGAGRGEIIRMPGLEVSARDVSTPARATRSLGADHRATMTLVRGHRYRFCVVNRLGLGGTVDFWVPTTTCSAPILVPSGASTASFTVTLAEQDLQAITVAADGLAFLNNFQLPVRAPLISTGNQAEASAPFDNGFVIGLGGHDPGTILASGALDGLVTTVAYYALPYRPLLNVDMVWPDGNPSRLVFAHEFGHHTFYQLLNIFNSVNPARYAQHMLTIMGGTIANSQPGPGEPAFESMAINEGFADIISAQLAGGTNRMPPRTIRGSYPGDEVGTGGAGVQEAYCDPTALQPACLETNIVGNEGNSMYRTRPGSVRDNEAGRFTTTLHDLMDDSLGQPNHNGPVWTPRSVGCRALSPCPSALSAVPAPGPSAGMSEEPVAVSFGVIANGIALWQNDPIDGFVFSTTGVMRGMTRSLRLAGVGDNDSCVVYALHHPAGECPGTWLP